MKSALVTGINGQDGSYLADILLEKGYHVEGIVRHSSTGNLRNIAHILDRLKIHNGDVTDPHFLSLLPFPQYDEVYHMADQDHVGYSYQNPQYSVDVTIKGTLNVLQRHLKYRETQQLFIPCSSTMFGNPIESPQDEKTLHDPQSPYACCKSFIFNYLKLSRLIEPRSSITVGIMYNHDSIRRHGDYLLHRICRAAVKASKGATQKETFTEIRNFVGIGEAHKFMKAVQYLTANRNGGAYCFGSRTVVSISTLIGIAFRQVGIERWESCIDFTESKVHSQQTLRPTLAKFQAVAPSQLSLNTDYESLVSSLVSKYRTELGVSV